MATFSTIPIVNKHGRLIGMIPKHFMLVLIENHSWYEQANQAFKIQYETARTDYNLIFDDPLSQFTVNSEVKPPDVQKFTAEEDQNSLPLTSRVLPWQKFNVDYLST